MTVFNNRKVLATLTIAALFLLVVGGYFVRRYDWEHQIMVINLGTKSHPRYWKITRQHQEEISAETSAQVQKELAKMMPGRLQK